mmetsp:Transcript_35186/g.35828  ORF Transcript_35186/g.35828 Transcript_35186/m.35828 type:complete len:331 (-) Transcript_35186:92-1084(-)|eukprot:CAMPEP_0182418070 /NCGR_PEP_ID=MMETSP1167-20130531/2528_1 /TAXON_ID=2988 /ORGANISM="Mallomonas Sp, Strain CCMP3275" /LENGTH=330 /DNA_ID=CAMNT_0024592049 /DNA_START=63 /DNA_END=1055 /DNA_ORIENTATION=+
MFASYISRSSSKLSSQVRGFKVAVIGASGGIGQPLSLLMKMEPKITNLALFDVVRTPGVAADVSHCPTPAKVTGYVGNEEIGSALSGADVVVIPAGVPRKPGMTRDDLFNINAGIVKGLAESCATACPGAMFLIISNPVNSMVPIFAEVLKKHNVYDKKKLFGVTLLDVCRANTFVAEAMKVQPKDVNVTVIGGHAGTTIVPLLSQVPGANFSDEEIEKLTHRIQFGGDEVVKAKDGAGSATLSMAYAANVFSSRLLSAMSGEEGVVECAMVENSLTPASFFATPVKLGKNGVEEVLSYGSVSAIEQANIDSMMPDLTKQIQKGVDFSNA